MRLSSYMRIFSNQMQTTRFLKMSLYGIILSFTPSQASMILAAYELKKHGTHGPLQRLLGSQNFNSGPLVCLLDLILRSIVLEGGRFRLLLIFQTFVVVLLDDRSRPFRPSRWQYRPLYTSKSCSEYKVRWLSTAHLSANAFGLEYCCRYQLCLVRRQCFPS